MVQPITLWQEEGIKVETVTDFIFLGSKIIADSDRCHEIKRHLLPGRKAMTNLDSILKKQRHYFADKGLYRFFQVKAMVFPGVMYRCESWTIKKVESQKIDGFKLWCWRRLLKSPLDCKEIKAVHPKGNQSWILTGRTDAEAEAPKLRLP